MTVFQTPGLTIRTWQAADIAQLHSMLSDPTTMAHWPAPLDQAAVQAWYERSQAGMAEQGYGRWCCELNDSGTIIGDVGIVRTQLQGEWINDLGYIIHHPYWRQGYAFEAATGAVAWAKAKGLDRLVATMAADNEASVAVARKLGMQRKRNFVNANNLDKQTYWFELNLSA